MAEKPKYYRSTFTFNGRRFERKSQNSQRDADRKADALKVRLERGEVGVSSNMTVKRWAYEWLEVYKEPVVGIGQYKNYRLYIDKVIVPAIGNKPLKAVTDIELQKIINSRAGNSRSDVSKLRYTIKAMFRRALASGLVVKNPAEYLELPQSVDGTHRSISPEERKAILALAENHRAGLWVKTILYCGLRPGETRALDWRHVDFKKKMLHVEQAAEAYTGNIKAPKTAAGIRYIPIPDTLLAALATQKRGPFEPVFTQPTTGQRHTKSSMRSMWLNFKRELDILMGAKVYRNKIILSIVATDLAPYCLRHTFATDLQDAGVPINIAKYLMGHTDISTTASVYTHTTEKAIQDAADKMNRHA